MITIILEILRNKRSGRNDKTSKAFAVICGCFWTKFQRNIVREDVWDGFC